MVYVRRNAKLVTKKKYNSKFPKDSDLNQMTDEVKIARANERAREKATMVGEWIERMRIKDAYKWLCDASGGSSGRIGFIDIGQNEQQKSKVTSDVNKILEAVTRF